jgi:putative peptidoglycan lipid II flippase
MKKQDNSKDKKRSSRVNSYIVGGCIFLSRIAGLIREILLAHFLGTSIYSDALKAALRIPNFLQNLFGEGVLSASFIPVYVRLIKHGDKEKAARLAKETGILLTILSFVALSLGILFSDFLVSIFAPGFSDETAQTTRTLLQIIFPGTALLVLSAWCLGILNSHRYFALSYSAPLFWNFSIILGLLFIYFFYQSDLTLHEISIYTAWFILIGSVLQLGVQLPKTFSLLRSNSQVSYSRSSRLSQSTWEVIKGFLPVSLGRGVVQISAYVDTIMASLLTSGSLSVLMYAQSIFLLPISVFGMAVSAAELPDLSEEEEGSLDYNSFMERLYNAQERILFFILPSTFICIFLGSNIISILFESGEFTSDSVRYVSLTLSALSLGLTPSTLSRLLSSSLYALSYHRVVSVISISRLITGTLLGALFAFIILPYFEVSESLHITGIGLGSTIGAWVEVFLLRRVLIKHTQCPLYIWGETQNFIKLLFACTLGILTAFALQYSLETYSRWLQIVPVLGFGVSYLATCLFSGVPEVGYFLKRK